MKITKYVRAKADVSFAGVTLLSEEEYVTNRKLIPMTGAWWWLRSPLTHSVSFAG